MSKRIILSLKVGATFLGTIVGAGFATGQEILRFFTLYRINGYIGIIVAIVLIIILGMSVIRLGLRQNSDSYDEFLTSISGEKVGLAMDILITVFLFGTINVMLSASGALFNQYFGVPYYFGIILTVIPTIIVVIRGVKDILNVNFVIAPTMIVIVFVISLISMKNQVDGDLIRNLYYESDENLQWLISAIFFASYNLILSIPILIPIAKEISNINILSRGIIIGSIAMAGLIFLINTVILNKIDENVLYQIPLLHVIEPFSKYIKYCFVIALWGEIFTTIVSNLFGLSKRITNATGISHYYVVLILCFLSIFISRLNFKMLLSILYPAFGLFSLIFIIVLTIKQFMERLSNHIIIIHPRKN